MKLYLLIVTCVFSSGLFEVFAVALILGCFKKVAGMIAMLSLLIVGSISWKLMGGFVARESEYISNLVGHGFGKNAFLESVSILAMVYLIDIIEYATIIINIIIKGEITGNKHAGFMLFTDAMAFMLIAEYFALSYLNRRNANA